ncbi:MAG: hypothetical protein JOZ47_10670 [Kutzneria sp.]|nr:hypothetical protein [Kutzneria sp.]
MKAKVGRFAVRLFVALLFALLALTAKTAAAGDEGTVDDTGLATVQSCTRYGPVDVRYGFGFWEACQVSVAWNRAGYRSTETIRPPYLSSADIGHQVRVDRLYDRHSGHMTVAHDYPRHTWVFAFVSVPCMGIAFFVLMWPILRTVRRRRGTQQTAHP